MNRNEKGGRLDRRITIQRATTAADDHGTPLETWADWACTWAHKAYLNRSGSGEEQHAAVHLATTEVVYTIRYRQGLLPTDRIVDESQVYDITRIVESPGPGTTDNQRATRRAYLAVSAEMKK